MNKNKSVLLGLLSFFFFAFSPSNASAVQFTQTQCLAAGGSYAASSADCTNTRGPGYFSIGDYVDATCVVKGVCCAQGSAAPSGPGCTAPVATGSSSCGGGSGVCKLGCGSNDRVINDDFNGDGANDTCKNFSAGGTVCCEPLAAAPGTPATTTGLNYQLLEKIPGTENLSGSDLPGYVSALYKVALVVVTLSAVLMLSIGGFMYLTSAGNTSAMSTAKGIIYDSLIGLVIALSAWLVLYIINPDLVEVTLNGLPAVTTTPAPTPTAPGPGGALPSGSTQDLADQILKNGNITLNASGSCKSPAGDVTPRKNITDVRDGKLAARCSNGCQTKGTAGCTENNASLSNKMLAAILAVGQTQRFTITSISGGPHASSSKHFSGNAIDIVPVSQALLDAFVKAGAYPPNGQAASMCENTSGRNVGCHAGSGADHIHLVF